MNCKTILRTMLLLVLITNVLTLNAQITKEIQLGHNYARIVKNFESFENMHIGYYGTTRNCDPYYIYAFKYKSTWFLVANQEEKMSLIVTNAPRQESKKNVLTGSEFALEAVSKAYINDYIKFKDKKKEEKEIDIRGFYKFNKAGKRSMKGILLLDYPEIKEEKERIWPFSMFQKKAEEVKEGVSGEIEEELKKEVDKEIIQEVEKEVKKLEGELKPDLDISIPAIK